MVLGRAGEDRLRFLRCLSGWLGCLAIVQLVYNTTLFRTASLEPDISFFRDGANNGKEEMCFLGHDEKE